MSLNKPYRNIKTVTVRNIFLEAMSIAGIDTVMFKAHSSRASATAPPGLTLKQILKMGSWRQASTFKRVYAAELLI